MSSSIKTLSKNVKTFGGSTCSLYSFLINLNAKNLYELHRSLATELRDKTILYTKDLEEKYKKHGTKRRRSLACPIPYIDALVRGECRFGRIGALQRMVIYFAADIPWVVEVGLPLETFKHFVSDLMDRSDSALITPGDMVGIIAAQSCSERFTQTTLNSVDYETSMAVRWTSKNGPPLFPADGEIGAFVDGLIKERKRDVELQPDGVTVYLPLKPGEAEALSTDEHGNMMWTQLEAVTRHPPINDDGTNTLMNISVGSGQEVVVTKGESMLIVRGGKIVVARGDEVKLGDMVPVTGQLPVGESKYLDLRTVFKETEYECELSWDFGFFIGAYLAGGNDDERYQEAAQRWPNSLGTNLRRSLDEFMTAICGGPENKRLPAFALSAPDEFVTGLLDAYFSGCGNVSKKNVRVTVTSRNLRDGVSHLLARYSIHTKVSTTSNGTRTLYRVWVCVSDFAEHIALTIGYKQELLDKYSILKKRSCAIKNTLNDVQLQPIVSITEQPSSHPMVYDLTVAGTRNMCTMSGVNLFDTFHSAGIKKSAVVGIKRIEEILNGVKTLKVPILGPITTRHNPEKLFAKTLGDYAVESGVVYRPTCEKHNPFMPFFKLKNVDDWLGVISRCSGLAKYKNAMFFEDGTVFFKSKSRPEPTNVARALFYKISNTHVSGLEGCIDFDYEDDMLIFSPKTSLVKTRVDPHTNEKTLLAKIDNNVIADVCPDVDLLKLWSNDIYYIETTYGVAAAENFINQELTRVLGNEGINLNSRHVSLLAAKMTVGGSIKPNTFFGVDIEDSVILKATFQESTRTFAKAAAQCMTDELNDVSAQILMGALPKIGTALSNCYKDVKPVVERVNFPPSPEYAPLSPEYVDLPVTYPEYIPSSPLNDCSASPYNLDEPVIDL